MKFAINVEKTDLVADLREQAEDLVDYEVDRLVCGTAQLADDQMTIEESGLTCESTVHAMVDAEGGKRKRKKKVFTTPKRIPHKHRKRSKAILEYFSVEASGKVKKLKQESPYGPPCTFMAEHSDRFVCGLTGKTFYRLTSDGKRLPIPKQNKSSVVAAAAPVKAAAKGKKKK